MSVDKSVLDAQGISSHTGKFPRVGVMFLQEGETLP
jgi:hypothetical protein